MTELLIYQGKAALALVAFYIFYRLLLSKETFHRFNRIVLLGTAAMAFVLPLCVITISKTVILPAVSPVDTVVETVEGVITGTASVPQEPIWPATLLGIFVVGALAVMLMTVTSIIKVMSIIRSGEHQTLDSGETLVITENGTAPFSWMKYIVLSREDYESGYSQILIHEKAHIALRHSWDLLFVDLITVLQWFNPVIWMLKSDLRALHEFEADDAVLRSGANIKEYQYLLIKKAVSKSGYSVANSFNHSTLKARITMMLNKRSSRMSAWKALYVIPLVGISLAATAETKVDYQYEDQTPDNTELVEKYSTPVDKDTKKSFKEKNLKNGRITVDEENDVVTMTYYGLDGKERKSQITGLPLGKESYFINGSFATKGAADIALEKDPDAVLLSTYLKNGNKVRAIISADYGKFVTGTIDCSKPINTLVIKEGEEQPQLATVATPDLVYVINGERMPEGFDLNTIDPATITSMEVLKTEKALQEYGTDKGVIVITTDPTKANEKKPAPDIYINGRKATSEEVAALPANPEGTISADGTVWITTEDETVEKPNPDEVVYVVTDKAAELIQNREPRFQGGGMPEFQKWVHEHIKYPEGVTSEGRVDVSFKISEDGGITDVKILSGADAKLNEEAIRVIESSGNGWVPAIKDGKKISITMMVPVIFKK